jgi:hypothetical protein
MLPLLATAEAFYDQLFPGGQPADPSPDIGASGFGYASESYAEVFAFMALVDAPNRVAHAQKARTTLMYVIEKAHACPVSASPPYAPFCDPRFPNGNRANYVGDAWGLTVDWLKAADPEGAIFTKADRKLVRDVFLTWARDIADPSQGHPPPPGASGPDLLSNAFVGSPARQFRQSANNYYTGSMRHLLLMALSVDPDEDPDGALGAYVDYARDKVMYQQYAVYEEASLVRADYGLDALPAAQQATIDTLGLGSGGPSIEGSEYGHSLGHMMEGLLGLHTAGQDGSSHGKQMRLFASDYWKRVSAGFLASMMYDPITVSSSVAVSPVYTLASYGDTENDFVGDWDYLPMFAALALRDRALGDEAQRKQDLWAAANAMPGGAGHLAANMAKSLATSSASTAILAFLAFDPAVPVASYPDPRPGLSPTFYSEPQGRILARTGWSSDATLFTHMCQPASINHVNGNCGQFELFRKGEWLTKEVSAYDAQVPSYGHGPDYHNILGIQNDPSNIDLSVLGYDEQGYVQRGGQWANDLNAGDPVSRASGVREDRAYVYAEDDATTLYNRMSDRNNPAHDSALDVLHASRSIFWLKPDHVVVYDRATTKSAGRFKRFNLTVAHAAPVVTGNTVRTTTPGGQHLFLQALLPAGAVITRPPFDMISPIAKLDPVDGGALCCRIQIESPDPAKPADQRFLNVLQGTDAGAQADPVTLLHSHPTSPAVFDGALLQSANPALGHTVVLFPVQLGMPAQGLTCDVSGAVDHVHAAGFKPGGAYTVSVTGGQVKISEGGPQVADSAGVVSF